MSVCKAFSHGVVTHLQFQVSELELCSILEYLRMDFVRNFFILSLICIIS